MAQKIYNNGSEGKILMSSAGKVIRQPYEFGSAFKNKMGLNNYLLISNIDMPFAPTTELLWELDSPVAQGMNLMSRWSGVAGYSQYRFGSTVYLSRNSWSAARGNHLLTPLGGYKSSSNNLLGSIIRTNNAGRLIINNNISNETINGANFTESRFSKIAISAIFLTSVTPSYYATTPISRYTLFSRELSDSECYFYYNNALGSEFQTYSGCEIDIEMKIAEILDFSTTQNGSDMRVGCRDYSGNNRHGKIMNLPAGTLSEQLAYANENLFVPFLI